MADNGNGWKSWVINVLLGVIVTAIIFGTCQIQSKADRDEVKALESRCEKRDDIIREDLNKSIERFNKTQTDIYNLLIERKK